VLEDTRSSGDDTAVEATGEGSLRGCRGAGPPTRGYAGARGGGCGGRRRRPGRRVRWRPGRDAGDEQRPPSFMQSHFFNGKKVISHAILPKPTHTSGF
jgi:hypothetical protein